MTDTTGTDVPTPGDRIEQVDLQLEMQRSYLDYAMSVIVGRAPSAQNLLVAASGHQQILRTRPSGGRGRRRPSRGCRT